MGGVVDYGTTKLGGTSTVEQVFSFGGSLKEAGPVSQPGIALDGNGSPWIAFAVDVGTGVDIRVAHEERRGVEGPDGRESGRVQRLCPSRRRPPS